MSLATSTRKDAQRRSDEQYFDHVVILVHELDISDIRIGSTVFCHKVGGLAAISEARLPPDESRGVSAQD